MIHTVKGLGVVNKAEVDVILELSWFFSDPWMLAVWSLVPLAFRKSSLKMWKFTVHMLLKSGVENFEHYFAGMRDEYNCVVV